MEAYKPPTSSSKYASPTASAPFSGYGTAKPLPSAFASHHQHASTHELPSAFSKSSSRRDAAPTGEWSAFGKRAVSPTKKAGETVSTDSTSTLKIGSKNSLFAHIEAVLDVSKQQSSHHQEQRWGQSALKKQFNSPAAQESTPPEKTFEEEFPVLLEKKAPAAAATVWGKQTLSMADKMRQSLHEMQKKKEEGEEGEDGEDVY